MATYVLPQVQVFQDFTIQPAVPANPLSAHISGGHAYLVRFNEADEKGFGNLGLYDNAVDTAYAWPTRPTGSVVDTDYTKLFIENALLQYFNDPLSAGSNITVVANYANRIRSATVNFKTNGAYARNAAFYDRDVKVGDTIRVRGVPTGPGASGDPVTLWTYVKGLVADEIAAVIDASTEDASNAGTQSSSATVSQTAGAENCVEATVDGTSYDGLPDGKISETYVITVLDSSVGGDLTTARVRVISGSGTDDQAEVTPAAAGSPTSIGTRGLTVTWDTISTAACSLSADNDGVSDYDLIAGQEFTVSVDQAFTATTSNSGGTYDNVQDTTYIVEVTTGGIWADDPKISVTTNNGVDQSGPHIVTGTGVDVTIGTRGVTIQFGASTGLSKGDRFYIPVTGIGSGPIRTIVLGQNLDSHFATGDEVGVELYIRKAALEVSADRTNFAPALNWEQSDTEITVNSGIVAYDSTWTDGGVPLPLDVYSSAVLNYGVLYVEYRAWLPNLVGQVNSLINVGDIDEISGPLTPDNPLKWGVFKALGNNNGTPVLYSAVANPNDLDTWADVLELLLTRDDAYGLVPLTRNPAVFSLFQGHINSASTATEGLWRVAWFNLQGVPEIPLVSAGSDIPGYTAATTTDGEPALATFSDDPFTTGTQYTICVVPAANSNFIGNGVRAGDIVRALYTGDGFGNYTYSEFVVDEVQSENQIRVKTGPAAPVTTPAKIEVWRNQSAAEEAASIAKNAAAFGSRRVRATWPDLIDGDGVTQAGYFLNCALAALSSGVLPQQGLTNVTVSGFSATPRSNNKFNRTQLNDMAGSGVWIVYQNVTGAILNRHAVTTGDYADINAREEMVVRNVDSISYRFKDYFAPYIGITNVTPSMRTIIVGGIDKLIRTLQQERTTPSLGGQLIAGTIERFFISEVFKDRYVAYISIQVPYALNNIELHLVV